MKPAVLPSDTEMPLRSDTLHFVRAALGAWRRITLQRWAWATAIALFFALAHAVGLLPSMLNAVPIVIGRPPTDWSVARTAAVTLVSLTSVYCFLLAISIAEHGVAHRLPAARRYVVAGVAACGTAVILEMAIYVLAPSFAPNRGGWALLQDPQLLLGRIVWSLATVGLSGGLALAVYVRVRSARLAREAFNAAELERVNASRDVLASRLAAMQAHIEPRFLLSTLAQVEALYDRDPLAGDRMLEGLIAYLHAALPQLRVERSTLKQEVELAESYLRIVQIRMGSRLNYRVDVQSQLDGCDFPPMMLLPLIDDALCNGLEPLPHGGTIALTAFPAGDAVRVRIADDGLPRTHRPADRWTATLNERLTGLYGPAARLEIAVNQPRGLVAVIEVPLATARDHR